MSTYVVEAQLKATGANEFAGAFDKASNSLKSLDGLGKQLKGVGKKLSLGVTTPILGIGAASVKTVAEFDDSMANVQKISSASEKELESLRSKAQELGSTTAYSASEAADGMGILAASGMETNKIIGVSKDMFDLMSAGSIDAETSARVLTNTMAQFNLETKDSQSIVDTFASGAASAKVGVDDLEHAMALAGGSLANMNMTVDESVAVMGQLANGAVPVEQLGSTVNAMSRDIIANSDEMEKFVDVYDSATGEMRGLDEILNDYADATKNMSQEERNAADQKIFTGKAQQGVNAWISKGSEGYEKLTKDMEEMGNAAEVMAGIQEDTLGGSFRALSSATEGLMIQIGDIIKGPLQDLALKIQEAVQWFSGLTEGQKKTIIVIALLAAAIGPVLLVLGTMASAVTAISGALTLLMGPVGIAIAIFAALVLAGILVYKNWDTIKEKAGQLKDFVVDKFTALKDGIVNKFTELKNSVTETKDSIVNKFTEMKDKVSNKFTEMGNTVRDVKDSIVGFFGDLKQGIVDKFWEVIDSIKGFGRDIVESVSNIDLFQAGKNIIDGLIGGLKDKWEAGKDFIGGIGGWIKDNKGPASYDKKLLIGAGNLIMGGLNKGLMDSFNNVKNNVHSMGAEIQKSLAIDAMTDAMRSEISLGESSSQFNSKVSHTLNDNIEKQPQVIYLNLGGRNYRAFVEDISNAQDSEIRLEESYSL